MSFSDDWFFILERNNIRHTIFGYDLGLNKSSSLQIANDKCATFDLLATSGTQSIKHVLFHAPCMGEYIPMSGNWAKMISYFENNGCDIVCKPNSGTGGTGVYRVKSVPELEDSVHKLFGKTRSICLSPFTEVRSEYRIIVLGGECLLVYEKKIPTLVGDGHRTVIELFLLMIGNGTIPKKLLEDGKSVSVLGDMERVPERDELIPISWKHNLGWGGKALILELSDPQTEPLTRIALSATTTLGLEFASIDVVEGQDGLSVIEANAGIMMEHFARSSPEYFAIASDIYARALDRIFGSKPA